MDILFYDSDGRGYNANDIREVLTRIGADDCDSLFIHSDIMFGNVPKGFKRGEYLRILYDVLQGLSARNIIVPAFTYSFCNKEEFDVQKSKTSMGSLSEFIRKQDGRYRTVDPLLSFSVPYALKSRFENLSSHSLGAGSGFDILNQMDGVKFLFFGAKQGECFTFVHYVEKMLDVPYRYDQPFTGIVVDYEGCRREVTQTIHTHCYGVKIPENYNYFEDELMDRGIVKKERLGNSTVSCIDKDDAFHQISDKIEKDPFYFVDGTYRDEDLIHKYGFGQNGERVTHC